jgi:hypothetical protein
LLQGNETFSKITEKNVFFPMKSLLILACSERKRPDAALIPAIERYEGPAFRVVRKFRRETPRHSLAVFVLSARFGLIDESELIPNYDVRMTKQRAVELQANVSRTLLAVIDRDAPRRIGFCVGNLYRRALDDAQGRLPHTIPHEYLAGGLGVRLTALKRWLNEPSHEAPVQMRGSI